MILCAKYQSINHPRIYIASRHIRHHVTLDITEFYFTVHDNLFM